MQTAQKIEKWLGKPSIRKIFKLVTKKNKDGDCYLNRVFDKYGKKNLSLKDRVTLGPVFFGIDSLLKNWKVNKSVIVEKVFGHFPTKNAIVNTAASIAQYGLTKPQIFSAPLMVVWNFTNACNLNCVHCYQDAKHKPLEDELSLSERLRIIDEMAKNGTVMLAFSGGEPLTCKDFWPCAKHAASKGMHISVATNGTLLTKENSQRLFDVGVRYVEVSIDSVNADKHDKFRGAGCWQKSIEGIKNIVAVEGLRVGLASTITKNNFSELKDLIKLSKDLGCKKFCAFNFIPTGRAKDIIDQDLDPKMREEMLEILYKYMEQDKQIGIMTTAPQVSRICLHSAQLSSEGIATMATAHIATTTGNFDVKTFAKYMGGCGAGRCYWAIQPNGLVTPCVFMQIVVGDLRKQSMKEIWDNSEVLDTLRNRDKRHGGCSVCDYKLYCGGCRARSWGYYKDLRMPDPGCSINQKHWDELVTSGATREGCQV